MPNDNPPPPTPDSDTQTLADLAQQLSTILQNLITAARSATDLVTISQLNTELDAVDRLLTQVQQAQFAADDVVLSAAITTLKAQAGVLTDMEAQITKVLNNVKVAATVLGDIAQAVTQAMKLIALL